MNASTIIVKSAISTVQFNLKALGVVLNAEEVTMLEDIASVTGSDETVTVRVTDTEIAMTFAVKAEYADLIRLTEFSNKDHFDVSSLPEGTVRVIKARTSVQQEETVTAETTDTAKEKVKPTAAKSEEKKEEVKVNVGDSWFSPKTKKVVGYGTLVCAVAAGGFFAWKKFHSTAE